MLKTEKAHTLAFLQGTGIVRDLIRSKDWSTTAIGLPDTWPLALRTSVNMLLNSRFPMFVWWGPELTTIYNDAYRFIAGDKHPGLLGRSGREAWAEIWDDLAGLVANVFKGNSNWSEDQLLYINRRGYKEEAYFTFSYSPILEETGAVGGLFCTVIETTEKILANRKLKESEESLRNIILHAPVAMCILRGENFIVEVANAKMFELWGIAPEGVAGMPLFDAVREAKNEGYEELMANVLKTGKPYSGKEQPVSLPRNGKVETVFINFSYEAIREADNTISGVMSMVSDVTEQVLARKKIEEQVAKRTEELAKVNEALVRTNHELARSNQNLEEFAHAASHDLKEPIRKVHVFSNLLKRSFTELNDEQHRLFERVEDATERMTLLVDDLLDYSHVSMGVNLLEDINLNKKVQIVLKDLEIAVAEKEAQITVGKLPIIKGHRRQLQQLFHNLIQNALKYSKKDTPPVIIIDSELVYGQDTSFNLPAEDAGTLFHLIRVQDNGIGFEQHYAEQIFQMFKRLHGKSEYTGSGVGLAIVKKVVQNHNGYISAEGKPGEGSLFKILLPAK